MAGKEEALSLIEEEFKEDQQHLLKELLDDEKKSFQRFQRSLSLIKKILEEEERKYEDIREEAFFSSYEKAYDKFYSNYDDSSLLKGTWKKEIGLSDGFLGRIYYHALDYVQREEFLRAEELMFFLVFIDVISYDYWFLYATILQQLEQYKEAIESYLMSLYANPQEAQPFLEISVCYFHMGEKEKCRTALGHYLDIVGDDPEIEDYEDFIEEEFSEDAY